LAYDECWMCWYSALRNRLDLRDITDMPTICIKIPDPLQELANGAPTMTASGTTVGGALHDLGTRHVALVQRVLTRGGAMRRHVNLFLNGNDIRAAAGLRTAVRDGDVLMVVASVAGG